jgi:hypothetical protein
MLGALFLTLNFATPATAQVFTNGNFEAPPAAGTAATYNSGAPPAAFVWRVTTGSVNHGTAPGQTNCHGGSGQCVDLNGGAPGAIEQTFTTVQWQKYRVTFYMSRHRQLILSGTTATLQALVTDSVGGGVVFTNGFAHSVPNSTAGAAANGAWTLRQFDFIAPTTSTTLAFASTTEQGAAGPQIDSVEIKPIPSYDIAVKKLHDGNTYVIAVNNPGLPIPVGSKIEVVDVVPPGLTLTVAASNLPWICAPTGIVVGPDSITCTLSVTAPIATNASLPSIHFQGVGSPSPHCPNCVRARLYLPNVIAHTGSAIDIHERRMVNPVWIAPKGLFLVKESNPMNNVSCIQ